MANKKLFDETTYDGSEDGSEFVYIVNAAGTVEGKLSTQALANLGKTFGQPGVSANLKTVGAGGGTYLGFPALQAFIADDDNSWNTFFGNALAGNNYGLVYYITSTGDVFFYNGDGIGGTPYFLSAYGNGKVELGPAGEVSITSGRVMIGGGGAAAHASAGLEMYGTTKGFLPPRMTSTQRAAISSPANGLMVYDTTLGKVCVKTAAGWEAMTSVLI